MIETILTKGIWAESLTQTRDIRLVTVHVSNEPPRPKVTAMIDLSRLEGREGGTAAAFIWSYKFQGRFEREPITQLLESPDSGDPNAIVKSISQDTFENVVSVTFAVRVTNMFAYANCSVFVYERQPLLTEFVRSPIRFFQRLLGP